jgi:CHAD domain-containing protein
MREYVRVETAILLRRLAFQVGRIAKSSDAESIHDLRVAIRRFNRCLSLFSQFYPGRSSKKARRRLDGLMKAAGSVRDLDIAIELLAETGLGRRTELVQRVFERIQPHYRVFPHPFSPARRRVLLAVVVR